MHIRRIYIYPTPGRMHLSNIKYVFYRNTSILLIDTTYVIQNVISHTYVIQDVL